MDELASMMERLTTSVAALNRFTDSLDIPDEDFTVTDQTGAVTVTATKEGRVTAITVVPRWPDLVAESELGIAINSAVAEASFHAMGMPLSRGDAPPPPPAPSEVEVVPTAADRAAADRIANASYDRLSAATERALKDPQGAEDRLFQANDRMNAVVAALDEPEEASEERLYSTNQSVSAVVTAFGISDVKFRSNWLAGKSGNVVTEALSEIIAQVPATTDDSLGDVLRQLKNLGL